jgi:hypothetical protein
MKSLLEALLERLNRAIGTVEVYNQLQISNQNTVLQGLNYRSFAKSEY